MMKKEVKCPPPATAVLTSSAHVQTYLEMGYNNGIFGPVSVTKGVLRRPDEPDLDVVLVTVAGWEISHPLSATFSPVAAAMSVFGLSSAYYRQIRKIMKKYVPAGSNVLLIGHSLGGVIVEQMCTDKNYRKTYNIVNTLVTGAPLAHYRKKRDGGLHRLGEAGDFVPFTGPDMYLHPIKGILGMSRESAGFFPNAMKCHNVGYTSLSAWADYDVLGVKNGSATLTLDLNSRTTHKTPWI